MHSRRQLSLLFPTFLPLLALAGCEGDPTEFQTTFNPCQPLVLEAPADATGDVLAGMADAIASWKAVATINLTMDPLDGATRLPVGLRDTAVYYGWYDDKRSRILISSTVSAREPLAVVLAHELGHAFGLYHVDKSDRVSVMNTANTRQGPTAGDGEALRAIWGACAPGPATPSAPEAP